MASEDDPMVVLGAVTVSDTSGATLDVIVAVDAAAKHGTGANVAVAA